MARKYPKPNPGDCIAGCELLEELPKHPTRGDARWRYRCTICGKIQDCFEFSFWTRKSLGCGCLNNVALAGRQFKDETGNRAGFVEFLERIPTPVGKKDAWYRCHCHNCDRTYETSVRSVRHATCETPSCGCIKDLKFREIAKQALGDYRESLGFSREDPISAQTNLDRVRISREIVPVILKRDDFTCACCWQRGGYLHAHHIYCFSLFPELRFELTNLITVCETCHTDRVHEGSGKANPEGSLRWREFFLQRITALYPQEVVC